MAGQLEGTAKHRRQSMIGKAERQDTRGHSSQGKALKGKRPRVQNKTLDSQKAVCRRQSSERYLQDFSEEAHVLIQKFEAGAEAMHATQHQGMVGVIFRLLP